MPSGVELALITFLSCAALRTDRGHGNPSDRIAVGELRAGDESSRLPSPSVADYVFTMIHASKFYGADRKVLDDITLAFLPGAKIGVLGANGAGKSTLLRIMAGREEPSSGR